MKSFGSGEVRMNLKAILDRVRRGEVVVVLSRGNRIDLEDLMYHGISARTSFFPTKDGRFRSLAEMERDYIKSVLESFYGSRNKVARILGIDRTTHYRRLRHSASNDA